MSSDKWKKNLELYDKLVDLCPDFERKGKTMPYTSANGHMFSLLNKAGELGIRLSKDEGKQFMQKYQTGEFKSHGAVMRGYVLIPESMLTDLPTLSTYLNSGYHYVQSLKPKPTKK